MEYGPGIGVLLKDEPPEIVVSSQVDLFAVGAVITDPLGRYLLQHRDDKPGLPVRDHWALFGGGHAKTETPEAALRRELAEELEFAPREMIRFHNAVHALVGAPEPVVSKSYFLVRASDEELAAMVQHEGQGKGLFTLDELVVKEKIAPWDLYAIMLYERDELIWG